MYNRYIPQSDGSFRRSRVAEQTAAPPSPPRREPPPPSPEQIEPPVQQPQKPFQAQRARPHPIEDSSSSVSSFLKGLLPRNFDTEDLLVILLLLLMSGNNSNDQNAALLTLGIYLFM